MEHEFDPNDLEGEGMWTASYDIFQTNLCNEKNKQEKKLWPLSQKISFIDYNSPLVVFVNANHFLLNFS